MITHPKTLRKSYVTLLVLLLLELNLCYASEPSTELFKIEEITAYADTGTLEDSKLVAIHNARVEAFQKLLHLIAISHYRDKVQKLNPAQIEELIDGFSVKDERMTSHSYSAIVSVSFKKFEVEALLSRLGIRYRTRYSDAVTIVPILHGQLQTKWNSIWAGQTSPWKLLPFSVARIEDQEVTKSLFIESYHKIQKTTNSNNEQIVLILADINQSRAEVYFRMVNPEEEWKIRFVDYKRQKNDLSEETFYVRIIQDIMSRLDQEWKGEKSLETPPLYSSNAKINRKSCLGVFHALQGVKWVLKHNMHEESCDMLRDGFFDLQMEYQIPPYLMSSLLMQNKIRVLNKHGIVFLESH